MSASGADEAIRPAAGRQAVLAGFLGGELALKLPRADDFVRLTPRQYHLLLEPPTTLLSVIGSILGNRGLGAPSHYALGFAESTG